MNKSYPFEGLEAWKKAKELSLLVYRLVEKFPGYERYDLCSQMRRSVISVASNIAEGLDGYHIRRKFIFLKSHADH